MENKIRVGDEVVFMDLKFKVLAYALNKDKDGKHKLELNWDNYLAVDEDDVLKL